MTLGGCGSRSGQRGLTTRNLTVGGSKRTYIVYLPMNLDPSKPTPFVFVFHGFAMTAQDMVDITQYTTLADSEGFGLAFPEGENGSDMNQPPWNVENPGQTVCGNGQYTSAPGDDFSFIDAIKGDVAQDQCLDSAHIFSTGFSMGGYFAHHIACYRNDMSAVAPHSGGTIADLSVCTTGHVPILILHGAGDTLIADACDDPTSAPPIDGFPASATLWAKKNGCESTYTTMPAAGAGGGQGQCYLYDGCPADGQVELCTFTGMNHCWAGGSATGGRPDLACPTYASATELEWDFFKKYGWNKSGGVSVAN
ncbi:MAG: alpha/beta hydrolase family esterase [Polyangiaceae bacterium]